MSTSRITGTAFWQTHLAHLSIYISTCVGSASRTAGTAFCQTHWAYLSVYASSCVRNARKITSTAFWQTNWAYLSIHTSSCVKSASGITGIGFWLTHWAHLSNYISICVRSTSRITGTAFWQTHSAHLSVYASTCIRSASRITGIAFWQTHWAPLSSYWYELTWADVWHRTISLAAMVGWTAGQPRMFSWQLHTPTTQRHLSTPISEQTVWLTTASAFPSWKRKLQMSIFCSQAAPVLHILVVMCTPVGKTTHLILGWWNLTPSMSSWRLLHLLWFCMVHCWETSFILRCGWAEFPLLSS